MGFYFNEKLSDEIKFGIKIGVNIGIDLNLLDYVVFSIFVVYKIGRLLCIRESMDMGKNE